MRLLRRTDGFTLVELLVVILIIGILVLVSSSFFQELFSSSVQSAQRLTQQTTIEQAGGFVTARLASVQGSLGSTLTATTLNPLSLAGDQLMASTENGSCVRIFYQQSAQMIREGTSSACTNYTIAPVRGPNQTPITPVTCPWSSAQQCASPGDADYDPAMDLSPGSTCAQTWAGSTTLDVSEQSKCSALTTSQQLATGAATLASNINSARPSQASTSTFPYATAQTFNYLDQYHMNLLGSCAGSPSCTWTNAGSGQFLPETTLFTGGGAGPDLHACAVIAGFGACPKGANGSLETSLNAGPANPFYTNSGTNAPWASITSVGFSAFVSSTTPTIGVTDWPFYEEANLGQVPLDTASAASSSSGLCSGTTVPAASAYFPLESGLTDTISGGPTLTNGGAVTFTATNNAINVGSSPGAAAFAGTASTANQLNLSSNPLQGQTAFTYAAWVQPYTGTQTLFNFTSAAGGVMSLFIGAPNYNQSASSIWLDYTNGSNTWGFEAPNPGSLNSNVSHAPLPDAAKWSYVVVTENAAGHFALYVNGQPVALVATATLNATPLTPSSLGTFSASEFGYNATGGYSNSSAPLSGALDHVGLYTSALTPCQAQALYATQRTPATEPAYASAVNASTPAAFFPLHTDLSDTASGGPSLTGTNYSIDPELGPWAGVSHADFYGYYQFGTTLVSDATGNAGALGTASAFTIEGWIMKSTITGGDAAFWSLGSTATTYLTLGTGGETVANVGTLCFMSQYTGQSMGTACSNPDVMWPGVWYQFAVTEDATGHVKLYIDGNLQGTVTMTYSGHFGTPASLGFTTSTPFYLGYGSVNYTGASTPTYLVGGLSDIAEYTSVLSAATIAQQYWAGAPF